MRNRFKLSYYPFAYNTRSRPWYLSPPLTKSAEDQPHNEDVIDADTIEREAFESSEEQNGLPDVIIYDQITTARPYYVIDDVTVTSSLETAVNDSGDYQLGNQVHFREAVLVSLGGAGAAITLLLVIGALIIARKRKRSCVSTPLGPQSPPILVYPPHDITTPCFFRSNEMNFSMPALRTCSMGELREDTYSLPGHNINGSCILTPPIPAQLRSNSCTNTCELGVLDPSLYNTDCLDEDIFYPDGHVGRVWFTLDYDANTERLQLKVIKAKHLPSRTPALANACDPYIRVQLVPDERRVVQTKQKKKTCNPNFDESFVFQIPSRTLEGLTMVMSIYDTGRTEKNRQLIGHITLPLVDIVAEGQDDEPPLYKMDIEKDAQEPKAELGEMLISLLYNENLGRLTVTVMEARKLKLESGRSEIVVRVSQSRACRGVRWRRTGAAPVLGGEAHLAEGFHFRIRPDELHTTSLTMIAVQPQPGYSKDRIIGKIVLGSYMFARGAALQHWTSAISSPMERVQRWHPLAN